MDRNRTGRRTGTRQLWTFSVNASDNSNEAADVSLQGIIISAFSCRILSYIRVVDIISAFIISFKLDKLVAADTILNIVREFYQCEVSSVEDKKWKLKIHGKEFYGYGKIYDDATRVQYGKRHIYITIPKFSMALEFMVERVNLYFKETYGHLPISQLWGREYHEDGQPHLHGILEFEHPIYIDHKDFYRNCMKGEANCNINACRNVMSCVKYTLKELNDQNLSNYYATGAFSVYLEEKKTKIEIKNSKAPKSSKGTKDRTLLRAIELLEKQGVTIQQLYTLFDKPKERLIILQNLRVLQNCITCIGNVTTKTNIQLPDEPTDPDIYVLWEWLVNLFSGRLRERENRHLFITGESMIGKSSFIRYIETAMNVYKIDNSPWFNPNYSDGMYSLAVYDEFTPDTEKKITDLNLFLRGSTYDTFNVKHSFIYKRDNKLPCLFISNYTRSEIAARLKCVEATPFIKRFTWLQLGTKAIPLQFRDYYAINHKSISTQTDLDNRPMLLYSQTFHDDETTATEYLLYPSLRSKIEYIGVYPIIAPERFDFKSDDYVVLVDPLSFNYIRRLVINEEFEYTSMGIFDKCVQTDILDLAVDYTSILHFPSSYTDPDTAEALTCNSCFKFELDGDDNYHTKFDDHLSEILINMIEAVLNDSDEDSQEELNTEPEHTYPFEDFMFLSYMTEEGQTCSICFEEECKLSVRLHCDHLFHHECMKAWYETRKMFICPLCKTNYTYGVRYIPQIDESIIHLSEYELDMCRKGQFVYDECHAEIDIDCLSCQTHWVAKNNMIYGVCTCNHCILMCNEGPLINN
jgi:hypothetical protein